MNESAWVYLAAGGEPGADDRATFASGLSSVCEAFGFVVFRSGGRPSESAHFWREALCHAEICIIEMSATTAQAREELALACQSGRPLIALRRCDERPAPGLRTMLQGHQGAREVAFDDLADCAEKLRQLFADADWQQMVRRSTVAEDFADGV